MKVKKFTVIELLVVMAIIAILIALLFPSISAVVENSKITKTKANAVALTNAIEQYLNTYYCLPILERTNSADVVYDEDDKTKYDRLIAGLSQTEVNGIAPTGVTEINQRKIKFLNLSNQQTRTGYVDLADNRFCVVFNAQLNRTGIMLGVHRLVGNVFVYSWGNNGEDNFGVGVDSPLRVNDNEDDIPGWDM